MNQIKLGRQIRKYRLMNRMTQNELSIAADVTRNYLSDLERGIKGCSIDTLLLIANELKISLDILLKDDLKMSKKLSKNEIYQDIMKLDDNEIAIVSNIVEGMIAKRRIDD